MDFSQALGTVKRVWPNVISISIVNQLNAERIKSFRMEQLNRHIVHTGQEIVALTAVNLPPILQI